MLDSDGFWRSFFGVDRVLYDVMCLGLVRRLSHKDSGFVCVCVCFFFFGGGGAGLWDQFTPPRP